MDEARLELPIVTIGHAFYRTFSCTEQEEVERDVCLLYHQLADYAFLMSDLSWGEVYKLPYWEYVETAGLEAKEAHFIRDGCLVMILTMLWECIDGGGYYIYKRIPECRRHINALTVSDPKTEMLIDIVKQALDLAERFPGPQAPPEKLVGELFDQCDWVHREYVRGYFIRMSEKFNSDHFQGAKTQ